MDIYLGLLYCDGLHGFDTIISISKTIDYAKKAAKECISDGREDDPRFEGVRFEEDELDSNTLWAHGWWEGYRNREYCVAIRRLRVSE